MEGTEYKSKPDKLEKKRKKTHYDSLEVHHFHLDILRSRCSKHYFAGTVPYRIGTCTMMDNKLHIHNIVLT